MGAPQPTPMDSAFAPTQGMGGPMPTMGNPGESVGMAGGLVRSQA
jgi:hypothetical protein